MMKSVLYLKTEDGKVHFKANETNVHGELDEDEFNRIFQPTKENNVFIVREEIDKELEEMDKMVNEALVASMLSQSKDPKTQMSGMFQLGAISEEFCKRFKCAPIDFIQVVRKARTNFTTECIKDGSYFDPEHHKAFLDPSMKSKNIKNKKKFEERAPVDKPYTLGDMLKEKGQEIKIQEKKK